MDFIDSASSVDFLGPSDQDSEVMASILMQLTGNEGEERPAKKMKLAATPADDMVDYVNKNFLFKEKQCLCIFSPTGIDNVITSYRDYDNFIFEPNMDDFKTGTEIYNKIANEKDARNGKICKFSLQDLFLC